MPAVVFDMDGVLIDSERLVLQAWLHVGETQGIPGLRELFYRAIGTTHAHTATLFADAYGDSVNYIDFRDRVREYYYGTLTAQGIPLKKGVLELLEWLSGNGWAIGLASSSREAGVRLSLERTGLLPYFRTLVCGDMLKRSKPAPDIYLRACAELGAEPAAAYAIEDSFNGIRSAHAAGMIPIMVPDMVDPDDEMRERSTVILPDLLAVRDWLKERRCR